MTENLKNMYVNDDRGYFSLDELSRLKEMLKDNYLHMLWFKMLYMLGITASELINIRVKDVETDHRKLHLHSSRKLKERVLEIPESIVPDIRAEICQRDTGDFLFSGRNGKLHPRTIQKLIEKLEKGSGQRISIAKLRRTLAFHMLDDGWDEKKVAYYLGHNSLRSTRRLLGDYQKYLYLNRHPYEKISVNAA